MPSSTIQWFPGHMAKTRRLMQECLSQVDLVIELLDARIPDSSRNPEILKIVKDKPILTLLNKCNLADPAKNKIWLEHYTSETSACLLTDCANGDGLSAIEAAVRRLLADKLARYREKGMEGRRIRAMVVGIPNVGKSSLINKLAGQKKARVENRPGVTVAKQWVSTSIGIDLLDMPGVLWPKFENERVAQNLAFTGAIKDDILQLEELAMLLSAKLLALYPRELCARYKLDPEEIAELDAYDLFMHIGKKRGFLMSGGAVNERRTADTLLDEFRAAQIGRMTLELPQDI
ncbi:MAG: ribosome biogenesis GTPase YlqF [Clostridia bacterium]|nr:ribosome biogenesis GTPase YlqF [Clostridia bacterium]